MILWARHSDLTLERVWHVIIPSLAAFAGFLWAGAAGAILPVLLALIVVSFGVNAPKPTLWAMPSMFLSGEDMAAGIGWINALGNIGGFVGPFLIGWMKSKSGTYTSGLDAVGAVVGLSAVAMLALNWKAGRQPGAVRAES
jgi:MFS transporter, ACS family, tartrate transporter